MAGKVGMSVASHQARMGRRQRGFTLMELMIAVAIVGILATLAMFAYNKYIKGARASNEVPAVLGEFRLRQGQYSVEHNGLFVDTGTSDTDYWPPTPSGSKVPTDITGSRPAGWDSLHITLDKTALYCAYVSRWGLANDGSKIGATASAKFSMTTAPTQNWFYVIAECDWDDNSTTNEFWFVRSDFNGHQVVDRKK